MNELIEELPETFEALKDQLEEDEKRWGDTWKHRSREGQEERIFSAFMNYYDQWKHGGQPIPWLKIMGESHIALVRERNEDEHLD